VLNLERGQLGDIRPVHWQTDTSVSNKFWGYIKNDTFKSPEFMVHQLIDIVGKNGNLLLNIGARSDGTIAEEVQQVFLDVGARLISTARLSTVRARGGRTVRVPPRSLRDRFMTQRRQITQPIFASPPSVMCFT
jgi:alpha-L-fucosidase